MRLAQEEHTDTGLTDTAADGVRQLFVEDCFLERKFCALGAAGFFQLGQQSLFVYADTHRGQLQGDVQNRIVNEDVGVQCPVIVVGCTAVVGLAVFELIADLHDADSALCFGDEIFTLLGRVVREHVCKLLGGDEENLTGQNLFDVIILDRHVHFRFAQRLVNVADGCF